MSLRAGSLCTGYGGVETALESLLDIEQVWICDNDPSAVAVEAARFPGVPNLGDLTATDWTTVAPVDVLTAGYPCQPFSTAGRRQGVDDERHLWPFIADAIGVLRPKLVFLENVAGHLSLGFDVVLGDLARIGYDAEWCLVRASAVGACHRRARLFILAHPTVDEGRVGDGDDVRAGSGANGRGPAARGGSAAYADHGADDGQWPRPEPRSRGEVAQDSDGIGDRAEAGDQAGRSVTAGSASRVDRSGTRTSTDASGRELQRWGVAGVVGATEGGAGCPGDQRERDGDAVGGGGEDAPDAERGGRDGRSRAQGRGEGLGTPAGWAGQGEGAQPAQRRVVPAGSGGPAPADADDGLHRHDRRGVAGPSAGRQRATTGGARRPRAGGGVDWGVYGPAIARHEATLGRRAPHPVDGKGRLSPVFVEWMQMLEQGRVTDVPGLSRSKMLKLLGNGVVPPQAAYAYAHLLERATSGA